MFRKEILTILAAVILLGVGQTWAYVVFDTNGVIKDGDVYDYVYVRNDAVVDMTGGVVTHLLGAEDFSIVNVSGGLLGRLGCVDFSMLNLSGDMQTDELEVHDSGTLNLSGSMQADGVKIWGLGTLNMFGGIVGSVEIYSSNASANLYGGIISEYLMALSTVKIYGYGFQYDPLAGDYRGGQLTGFWMNNTPFSIDLYYSDTPGGPLIDTYSHIVLIPEPATFLLLGLGVLLQRRLK